MITALRRESPALFFYLGDGERDLAAVREIFPALPYYSVRGNCDLRSSSSASLVCVVGGVRLFAAHGHLLDVKYDARAEALCDAARKARASVALFGHTHRPFLERRGELLIMNPGSIGRCPHPGYGLLLLEDGRAEGELRTL